MIRGASRRLPPRYGAAGFTGAAGANIDSTVIIPSDTPASGRRCGAVNPVRATTPRLELFHQLNPRARRPYESAIPNVADALEPEPVIVIGEQIG
jgi:hypothetical protein